MVGTNTSASATASPRAAESIAASLLLKVASNSSPMRASTAAGSLRVTTTFGLRSTMLRFEKGSEGGRVGRLPAMGFERVVLAKPLRRSQGADEARGRRPAAAMRAAWLFTIGALAALGVAAPFAPGRAADEDRPTPSGLPVPRYVTLKFDDVNARSGPSDDHRLLWTYHVR